MITFVSKAKIINYFCFTSNNLIYFKIQISTSAMEKTFRCDCPVTSALDILGDKWSLVIIKQMLMEGMKTFKDFSESDEAIASNILSARLKMLEQFQIVRKEKLPHNKKTNIYVLTERGLALAPTIIELALWSHKNVGSYHSIAMSEDQFRSIEEDKTGFIKLLVDSYMEKN